MSALRLYDVSTDTYRDATQEDIDNLQRCVQAYGRLREKLMAALATTEQQRRAELEGPTQFGSLWPHEDFYKLDG